MPGLFSSINFKVIKTPSSSVDLKILDTVCDHKITNEKVSFDPNTLFFPIQYNDGEQYSQDQAIYNSGFNPNPFIYVTTNLPLADNNSIEMFELPLNSFSNTIQETFTIPDQIPITKKMLFPPKINSVIIKQQNNFVDVDGTTETTYSDFNNYTLSQYTGNITFTNTTDSGQTVLIKYVGDIRKIFPKTKDMYTNWEFVGYDSKGNGIFKIFARSFYSSKSTLIFRYKTNTNNCAKCGGTNFLNDLDFDNNGRVLTVFDFSKLIQDFFKRFLTRRGSNPFDFTDGTQIPTLVGMSKNNPTLLETLMRTEVVNLLNVVRLKQTVQMKVQGISNAEQIQQINRIDVNRANPTDVDVNIEILSKSGDLAQLHVPVKGD